MFLQIICNFANVIYTYHTIFKYKSSIYDACILKEANRSWNDFFQISEISIVVVVFIVFAFAVVVVVVVVVVDGVSSKCFARSLRGTVSGLW